MRTVFALNMRPCNKYTLYFSELKNIGQCLDYELNSMFFESFGFGDFMDAQFSVKLNLTNVTDMAYHFLCNYEGMSTMICDVSNNRFKMPFQGESRFYVKFGSAAAEDLDFIMVSHGTPSIDLSQFFYEMIVSAVPQKRVSPSLDDERQVFFEYPPQKNKTQLRDSRWDQLKKII